MSAGGLAEMVGEADLVQLLVVGQDAPVQEVFRPAADVVELAAALLQVQQLLLFGRVGDAATRRGEQTHIVEQVRIVLGDGERVAAAHREAGDGAPRFLPDRPVVAVDEGDDLSEGARKRRDAGPRVLVRVGVAEVGRSGLLGRIPVGHHEDHRLRLPGGDEVVENLRGAPEVQPGVLVAGVPVQEIEDGIALLAVLIARRRVDVHAAAHLQHGAVVPARSDGAVRDVLHAVQVAFLSADDEVVHPPRNVLHHRIVEVQDGFPVHGQAVEIHLGSERGRGVGPYPVDLPERGRALHEFTRHLDLDGLGIAVAEGDTVVRVDGDPGDLLLLGEGRRAEKRENGKKDCVTHSTNIAFSAVLLLPFSRIIP